MIEMIDPIQEYEQSSSKHLYRRYWLALYHRDVAAASLLVEQCLRDWTPQRIYLRLFEPSLILSGIRFAQGKIDWRDEHFITHHTSQFLRRVRRSLVPDEPTGPLAVVTGIEQDSHLIGLRMVCDFMARENWRIHWLTSNDRAVLRQTLLDLQPRALLLSLGLDRSAAPAARMIATARRSGFGGLIIVGGGTVNRTPGLAERLGADMTASNGVLLVRKLRRWCRLNALKTTPAPPLPSEQP